MKSKTCIIVTGPTAIGKTAYAIELARKYDTEIISADSRQCFRELHIGVAKPTNGQLASVPHHFINSHSIHDEVNVKVFEEYALRAAHKIFETKDITIVAGGTGLYIKAFCEGLDELPEASESTRSGIIEAYKRGGLEWLREEIKTADPVYFTSGEMQNPQRMMRALEIKLSTGQSILSFHTGKKAQRDFGIEKINLDIPRKVLYQRINERVDNMMADGFLEEAAGLLPYRNLNALQTVGYRELFEFMDGKGTLDATIGEIKKNTRHFAKRQITWFKKFG